MISLKDCGIGLINHWGKCNNIKEGVTENKMLNELVKEKMD